MYFCGKIFLRPMKARIQYFCILTLITLFILPAPALARKKDKRGRHSTEAAYVIEPDMMAAKAVQEKRMTRATAMHSAPQGRINSRYKEGIDVSHYQGRIDWDQVAGSSKISYAYLKATEGANFVDDTYERNLREARRVGLSVGSYHFYRPNVSPEEQFRNLTNYVKASEQDLVPLIDIESRGRVSEQQFVEDLKKFVRLVEKHYGKKPLLYSYQNFYNRHLSNEFPGYPWMIAKYQSERPILTDGKDYLMWQYSSTGSIPGIKGNVDRSRLMGNHSLHQIQL